MKSFSWLKSLCGRVVVRGARRPARRACRPRLERLEDRSVPSSSPALTAYGNLPLAFEANVGQTAPQVDFQARGEGYSLALAPSEAVLALQTGVGGEVLRLQFVGANPSAPAAAQEELATRTNYLIGSDPSRWHTNIANYGQVTYRNVYSGIDLVYYGNQRQLEYDFVVSPGGDPGAVHMSIQGAESTSLDAVGNLVLHTTGGELVQHAPVVYQQVNGVRQSIAGRFVLQNDNQVGFRIDAYDASRPLVIDPVLSYSTYLGGSGQDEGQAVAVDGAGNAYVTGWTTSANFPATAGSAQAAIGGGQDVFVAKLNAAGTGLVYCTYLGGGADDSGSAIAVDSAGNAYLTGVTSSANFPTTPGAVQANYNLSGIGMAFVTELNAGGSAILYSSYLGSTGNGGVVDWGHGIALNASGGVYVSGTTSSTDFMTTAGALQSTSPLPYSPGYNQAFVARFDPSQSSSASLVYSTYLNGWTGTGESWANGIVVNAAGNAYVTGGTDATDFPTTPGAFATMSGGGTDAYVSVLTGDGSGLVYSTLFGGTGTDFAEGIALDSAGNAYIAGIAQSANLPITSGAFDSVYGGHEDGFVAKLNPTGSALVYSTFLGGSDTDEAMHIAVDGDGHAYVSGQTDSTNFPTTANALQSTKGAGYDTFVTKLNTTGSAPIYSSYLGGSGDDLGIGVAVDAAGSAYVVGETTSANFPTTPGASQQAYGGVEDAFVAKIDATASPSFSVSGFPSITRAGAAGAVTVVARDADGNPLTDYTGTVHLSSSDPQAVVPADYTFTIVDQGAHTFNVTLKTAGTQSIAVADTANANFTGSQPGITVNAAAATRLAVSGFPSPRTAGVSGSFSVRAVDAYGNTAVNYTSVVTFSASDSQAVLPRNYTFVAADAGLHTFSATLKTAGVQSITARDATAGSIAGVQTGITVNPAAASRFLIIAPSNVSAGQVFGMTITVLDAYGNVATGYRGTIHFMSSDGTANLPANYTFTGADNGAHSFGGLILRKKGKQKVTIIDVLDSTLTAVVTENVT
jgi:hypothetical protein